MCSLAEQNRFDAAVKIIGDLPKDGPFQPSNEMKLRFYALFKQATVGPCTTGQPAFWDLVNRAKWTAWNSLGDMPKKEAMRNYVDSLKEVVETMTLDANVQDFLEKIDPLYEFVTDDGKATAKSGSAGRPTDEIRPGYQLSNGGHHPQPEKANGTILVNGTGPLQGDWSDEKDQDKPENRDMELPQNIRSIGSASIKKIDLEGASDEEKFDDASDNQAFAAVGFDIAPAHSSTSHSLSPISTTRRSSKATQSREEPRIDGAGRASSQRRRAATALGHLLRELPELTACRTEAGAESVPAMSQEMASPDDSVISAWTVLRQIHADQVRRLQDDEDWFIKQLKRGKRDKSGHRKHRGGNGNSSGSGGDTMEMGEGASRRQPRHHPTSGDPSVRRSPRRLSGDSGSSSNSSGTDFTHLYLDPNVGAVLLRMHRELQHINRQLQFVEGILITQQEMIRGLITNKEHTRNSMRLRNFFDLPWRTIGFILAWPVIVHVLIRLCSLKLRRRK